MRRTRIPRVLVIEDDPTIRLAVKVALERHNFSALTREDGTSLESAVAGFQPDLAILDVRLPRGPDGFEIANALRRDGSIAILFLSAADDVTSRLTGFEAGADDYMIKPFAMPELMARVNALLRRTGRLVSPVWEAGGLVLDHAARSATRAGESLALTPTEFDLLVEFTCQAQRVVTRDELLESVWRYAGYGPNLIEVHVSSLRKKLEKHGPRVIHTVRGVGYRFEPQS